MKRYEQVPEALALDARLSLGARAAYPVLRHLAWRSGRRTDGDAVALPPVEEIAQILGAAPSTTKTYIAELRGAGWVETRRAARNRPALYVIHDEPQVETVVGNPARPQSDIQTAEGSLSFSSSTDIDRRTSNEVGEVPKVLRVNGRDLAFDALADVCGIREKSPRLRLVAVALNAPGGKAEDGIRAQFARDVPPAEWNDPAAWERQLAIDIRARALLYRQKMPGAALTPTALAKWWTDLPGMPDPGRSDGRVTAAQAFAEAQELQRQGR